MVRLISSKGCRIHKSSEKAIALARQKSVKAAGTAGEIEIGQKIKNVQLKSGEVVEIVCQFWKNKDIEPV